MFILQDITVLYIESDPDTQKSIANSIRKNGMKVLTTDTTMKAYELFTTHKIDIILLDCRSENTNELDFIRHLRENSFLTPVILTINDTDELLLFEAINLDISRCILKPYAINDLIEALKVAAARILLHHPLSLNKLQNGFTYDLVNKSVIHPDGTVIKLSKKEYVLIELLLNNRGKIIPYSLIESSLWEEKPMSMDALRTLVGGIRKKTYSSIFSNHNGIGYKIEQ